MVSIRSLHDASVRLETWISVVAEAMTIFFDCKTYSTTFGGGEKLEWTFYGQYSARIHEEMLTTTFTGLAEHTVAAAYGFEMVGVLSLELTFAIITIAMTGIQSYP